MIKRRKNKLDLYKELIQERKKNKYEQETIKWQPTTKQQQSLTA